MSAARELPRRVLVAGDGQVGALAALALRQALPASEVVVVGTPPDPAALADWASTALPFTNRLHDRLGIDEFELVRRAGASHRLVVRYQDWAGPGREGIAAYGAVIDRALKTVFAREWGGGPRNAQSGRGARTVSEALAAAGRFAPPSGLPGAEFADVDYALRWNSGAYLDLIADKARTAGVRHVPGRIGALVPDGQGGAAAVMVEGVGQIPADLFVDCTGPAATLLAQLPGAARVDWSASLPARQLHVAPPGEPAVVLGDRIRLVEQGWVAELAGRDGLARSFAAMEGTSAAQVVAALGGEPGGSITLTPGRAGQAWIGNVVALGDAAAQFEPLGWLNLDLAHRQLALLLELLPGQTPDPRERDEYNRRSAMMADRVCDWIAAHYTAPGAADRAQRVEGSPELALALDQYIRRGRLPFFEEMPMLVQEWFEVLIALGIEPGAGVLDRLTPSAEREAAARAHAVRCEAALRAAPPYVDCLGAILSQG